jgi:hypothetical protein
MWRLVCLVLLIAPLAAQAGGTAAAKYQALVSAAKRGEQVDCQALRFAWVDATLEDLRSPAAPAKSSDAGAQAHQDMRKAFSAEDWTRAAAQAQIAIDANFIDVDAHMTRDVSFRMLGKADQGRQNYQMATCLLQSIRTGDGLSPATAMTVVRVSEEYTILRLAGLRPEQQSLIEQGGHFYDVLDATDEHGKRFSIYFLVDRVRQIELAMVEAMHK